MNSPEWQPIGAGHQIMMRVDPQDRFTGLIDRHTCNGGLTDTFVFFDVPWNNREELAGLERHKVDQWEPLTLSPSLVCVGCGRVGWIRDGQWITTVDTKAPAKTYPVPVTLTIEGHTVEIGKIDVTPDRSTVREREDLSALLRTYAERLCDDTDDGRG